MKRKVSLSLLAVPVLFLTGFGLWYGTRSGVGNRDSITIGMEATAVNSLIYIAAEMKFFERNGLDVTIRDSFPSGAAAAGSMLDGELDFATIAEFGVVRHVLAGHRIRVLASIDRFMHMKLVTRKDRGIEAAGDLAGKRIGVPFGTAADFILGRYLDLNGIAGGQVELVDIPAAQAGDALSGGDVSAAVTWQPFVSQLEDRMGDSVTTLAVQSGRPMFCLVVTTENSLEKNPGRERRLLRALTQAMDFLVRNEARARGIIRERLEYDGEYMDRIWPEHQFSVQLDESLILTMEDQARWTLRNNLTETAAVPDFLEYISEDSLKAEAPGTVDIVR